MIKTTLALAERGLRVFPIKPNLKFPPLIQEWQNKATTDAEIVTRWWTQWPTANIGIATGRGSGIIVLDVDMKREGQNGEASLKALEAKHGPLPKTVETITPHKGRQLWFRAPEFEVRNNAGALGLGLDMRGDGGYVVAPPSCVSDADGTGKYVWSLDSAKEFADAPEWIFPRAEVTDLDARRVPKHWQRIARGVSEGTRNQDRASLIGLLLRKGIDPETTLWLALGQNRLCTPPDDEAEVVKTFESILAREIRRRGGVA